MHRFKKVGVVLDLNKPNTDVLSHAKELSDINQADIHVLCVLPPSLDGLKNVSIKKKLQSQLTFDAQITFLVGKPVIEITKYVDQYNLDILLIESEEIDSLNKYFFGSLPHSLMRKAPCPVWMVKKPVKETYEKILIAIDWDETETASSFNDKLVEIGTSYATLQSAECYLVTVFRLVGESILSGPYIQMPEAELEERKNKAKAECAQAFEKIQARHKDILHGVQTVMLYGEPGAAIPEFVSENDFDLIIMGTLARTGIKGFVIGNTAETILNRVDCSIMAIKPEGFLSPILA